MARFKVGESAIIKESGKKCVIKGVETKHAKIDDDHKRTDVIYVARTEDGEWGFLRRHELSKMPEKPQEELPFKVFEAGNGWKVVVVAIKRKETKYIVSSNIQIGFSIYNPVDKWDLEYGIRIAKYRAKKRPLCSMFSYDKNEFGKETTNAILYVKGQYVVDNLDKFAQEYKQPKKNSIESE